MLPVIGTTAQVVATQASKKSIEHLGLTLYRRWHEQRLLLDISAMANSCSVEMRYLSRGKTDIESIFNTGGKIMALFDRSRDDILSFFEEISPSDILLANDFFNPGKLDKLNENKKRFAENPEVQRYLESGKGPPYWPYQTMGETKPLSTAERAEILFCDLSWHTKEFYRSHLQIAEFLYRVEHGNIPVKNSHLLLKSFGDRYVPFKELVIQKLNEEARVDMRYMIETKKLREKKINMFGLIV